MAARVPARWKYQIRNTTFCNSRGKYRTPLLEFGISNYQFGRGRKSWLGLHNNFKLSRWKSVKSELFTRAGCPRQASKTDFPAWNVRMKKLWAVAGRKKKYFPSRLLQSSTTGGYGGHWGKIRRRSFCWLPRPRLGLGGEGGQGGLR